MRASISRGCCAVFALSLATACNDDPEPVEDYVSSWASSTADFSEYETYRFATAEDAPPGAMKPPEDVQAQLMLVNDAMRAELNARGMREVTGDTKPDVFAFNVAATMDEEAVYWDCVEGWWWWGYYYWSWDPCAYLVPVPVEYEVGTVILGLSDVERKEVVFGGVIQGLVDNRGDLDQRVKDAVSEVFDDYPVPEQEQQP
jgi:hypothetical protein